jgi:hypothetical protein
MDVPNDDGASAYENAIADRGHGFTGSPRGCAPSAQRNATLKGAVETQCHVTADDHSMWMVHNQSRPNDAPGAEFGASDQEVQPIQEPGEPPKPGCLDRRLRTVDGHCLDPRLRYRKPQEARERREAACAQKAHHVPLIRGT